MNEEEQKADLQQLEGDFIRQLIASGATIDIRHANGVAVVKFADVLNVLMMKIIEILQDEVIEDNPDDDTPDQPEPEPEGLRQLIVPTGYATQDLKYNNEFRTLMIDSLHGTPIISEGDDPQLLDAWKRWNVVALDGNSEKCIKACIPGVTHDITDDGILLRTAGYNEDAPIAQWVKDSYGRDAKATHGGMISTEGRFSFKRGVFQALVRKNRLMDGDHASLWLLSDDPRPDNVRVNYPPEEDLFEQVPGDSMGNGLSMNVHGAGDVFERFPDITLDTWTLMEIELTDDEQIIFSVNGVERKRTRNPFPDTPRYALFTFESNGNWPSAVGKRTSYSGLGSEYQFAYWRCFSREG